MDYATDSQTQPRDAALEARLHAAWRRQQMVHLARGLSYLLAWAGAIGLAVLAVDWLLDLPGLVRVLLLAVMLGVGLRYGRRHGWRWLRAYRARWTGLHVERVYPQLRSLLVCYIDFTRSRPGTGTSTRLRDHVCREAVEQARPLDLRRIAPFAAARRALVPAAVVIGAYAVLAAVEPQMMAVFAQRLFNPASTAAYPTDTVIVMPSGDIDVPEGGEVRLEARATGVRPERGALHIRSAGREWEQLDIESRGEGRFAYTFHEVHRGFEYRFALGDAESETHRVRVIDAPRIENAHVEVEPPDYMHRPDERRQSLTLTAPEGAMLQWTVRLDKPVSDARLLPEGDEPIAMTTSADGRTVHAKTVARASGAYRFHWREREHGFEYEGAKHYLQVDLDHEPRVRIDYPPDNEKATLSKTLSVTFAARDDHGVVDATLVHRRNESEPVRTSLGAFKPGRSIEHTLRKPLSDLVADLKEGDIVTYHVEVSDAYPGREGAQRATSAARRVQILSEDEYIAYMQRRRQSLLGTLRPVYRQERVASENVRRLKDADVSSASGQTEADDDGS